MRTSANTSAYRERAQLSKNKQTQKKSKTTRTSGAQGSFAKEPVGARTMLQKRGSGWR
jgi:hypothetical protein